MTRKRRSFSPEFKQKAARPGAGPRLHHSLGQYVSGRGRECHSALVKQLTEEREGVTPKGKALTPEQRRIQELEARCKRIEQEKDILKKATALLMSDDMNRMR